MGTFECTEKVTLLDIGQNFLLSNKGILRILQEVANKASSQVGHGIADINSTGTTWVLLYWRLKVYERIPYDSEIKVKTWASFSKKLYSNRCFELYSEDKLIAKADSKWVFVDAINHNIQKISDEMVRLYGNVEQNVFEEQFNDRIKFSEDAIKTYEYQIMKHDLDANHHANNNSFLDIAIEALPDDVINNNFSNLSIIYKKELNYKDKVSCYYELKDNKHIVYLYNDTTDTFSSIIIFE